MNTTSVIREVTDEAVWDGFVSGLKPNTFLHSWAWGQVQKAAGQNVRYVGFYTGDQLVGAALVITVNARRGRHYLVPHGPIFRTYNELKVYHDDFIRYLQQSARNDGAVALRIAPLLLDTDHNRTFYRKLKFRPAPLHVHSELTWMLDLDKPYEQLEAGMRKTTRHAIRNAAQAGIELDILTDETEVLCRFMPLYDSTGQRHKFVPFQESLLKAQVHEFNKRNKFYAIFGRQGNRDVAAALLFQYGSTVFYHHGASRQTDTGPSATHAVQAMALKEAVRRGALRYNFWGIAPADHPHHPFAGITVFKQGFGGYAMNYMHAQDLRLSLGYWKLWLIEQWRRMRRGF